MMQLSTLIVVYPLFYYWASNRPLGPASKYELWPCYYWVISRKSDTFSHYKTVRVTDVMVNMIDLLDIFCWY